jgi:SAM-dependent methyltransferase
MEDWAGEKLERVYRTIRELNLPESGMALDFGCGNGVFTGVLQRALPGWKIFGCDVSATAIANAKKRFADCTFFVAGDPDFEDVHFDFVLSHHVIEHVWSLDEACREIAGRMHPRGAMLHFLPCGNPGSLEFQMAAARTDGIDPSTGNRFFYEDEGHLRRLRSDELAEAFSKHGFLLNTSHFANHFWGAIKWITEDSFYLIRRITGGGGKYKSPAIRIRLIALGLWGIAIARYPSLYTSRLLQNKKRTLQQKVRWLVALPLWPFSKLVDLFVTSQAEKELRSRRLDPSGSEMALHFVRG